MRLLAYDQDNNHLPRTEFRIFNYTQILLDEAAEIIPTAGDLPFAVKIVEGKGVVYTLRPLKVETIYRVMVEANSRAGLGGSDVRYHTTFVLYVSVSAYPY